MHSFVLLDSAGEAPLLHPLEAVTATGDAGTGSAAADGSVNVITGTTDNSNAAVLALVAAVESNSEHPLGKAIVRYCQEQLREQHVQPTQSAACVENFAAVPGRGLTCTVKQDTKAGADADAVDAATVVIGNTAWMSEHGIALSGSSVSFMHCLEDRGCTVVVVAIGARAVALVALRDSVKPEAGAVVAALRARGKECWMVTGDSRYVPHVAM